MANFNTISPDWHNNIVKLVQEDNISLSDEGFCFGGATSASFAFLRGIKSRDAFIESVNASDHMTPEKMEETEALLQSELKIKIQTPIEEMWQAKLFDAKSNLSPMEEKMLRQVFDRSDAIVQFRKKAHEEIMANPEIREYMDTKALLQNIVVNFDASKFPDLLPGQTDDIKPRGQRSVMEAERNLQSISGDHNQDQRNTMVIASSSWLPYSKNGVDSLIIQFVAQCDDLQVPLSLMLGGNDHAVSCTYDPIEKQWLLFDMNQQPYYGIASPNDVCDFIWKGMVENLTNEHDEVADVCALNTIVISSEYEAESVNDYHIKNIDARVDRNLSQMPLNILKTSLGLAVKHEDIDSIKILVALPKISNHIIGACLEHAAAHHRINSVTALLAAREIPTQYIVASMQQAMAKNDQDILIALASSQQVDSATLVGMVSAGLTNEHAEAARALACSSALDQEAKLEIMVKAIDANDIETISSLSSSTNTHESLVDFAYERAMKFDKPEAVNAILASQRVSEKSQITQPTPTVTNTNTSKSSTPRL